MDRQNSEEPQEEPHYFDAPKGQEYSKSSLWNNPAARRAYDALSDKDKEHFRTMGEHVFSIDYEKVGADADQGDKKIDIKETKEETKEVDPLEEQTLEATAYIVNGIKSGLHPSLLEDNELRCLELSYGKEWYVDFGYTEKDLKGVYF